MRGNRLNRQAVILGMRFGMLVLVLAVNAYAFWTARWAINASFLTVLVLSLFAILLFHLLLAFAWEPFRLGRIARKAGEMPVIPPHHAWSLHRDSRTETSMIPGTLAMTDRHLRFVSSPLYTDDEVDRATPVQMVKQVSDAAPNGRIGFFLTLTLSDGAKMRIKLMSKGQQNRWLQELRSRVYEKV
ncbi:MAG: hypothetical protein ACYDCO_07335 [Armatimonadota bacterium]